MGQRQDRRDTESKGSQLWQRKMGKNFEPGAHRDTTRDIHKRGARHYLSKLILQRAISPETKEKCLMGHLNRL